MTSTKVKVRIGYRAPILPNIAIGIVYLPREIATKAIEGMMVLKLLLQPYAPELSSRLVCEAS